MSRPRMLLLLTSALLLASLLPARRITSTDMAWSIQPGDWVWVLPQRVRPADVVVLRDPLDPERTILRRAISPGDKKIFYDETGARVNGKRIRQTEMGVVDGGRVRKEVIWSRPPARENAYLTLVNARDVRWKLEEAIPVPEGHWFLLADNRDGALDSRWWGPVPEEDILGVVRFRIGTPDAWRPRFELLLPEE